MNDLVLIWLNVLLDHPVSSGPAGTIIAGLLAFLLVGGFFLAWRRGRHFTPELEEEDEKP